MITVAAYAPASPNNQAQNRNPTSPQTNTPETIIIYQNNTPVAIQMKPVPLTPYVLIDDLRRESTEYEATKEATAHAGRSADTMADPIRKIFITVDSLERSDEVATFLASRPEQRHVQGGTVIAAPQIAKVNESNNHTETTRSRHMETSVDITLANAEPLTDADFARDWWSADRFRVLPGEQDDHTVFVIDFYDQCKFFGYTKECVFHRAASLAARIGWGPNAFVMEHAQRVPYTIRCIKSGLNDLQARRLRNMLVAQAPQNLLTPRGSIVQTPTCWLHEPEELHLPETVLENHQG